MLILQKALRMCFCITIGLRRICDSDEKFDMRSDEYQNYLIARDYISVVKKQFHFVRNISRSKAKQVKQKVTRQNFNLVTVYNCMLNNLQKVIRTTYLYCTVTLI